MMPSNLRKLFTGGMVHLKELAINVDTTPAALTLLASQDACGEPAPGAAHRCISQPASVDAVVAVAI